MTKLSVREIKQTKHAFCNACPSESLRRRKENTNDTTRYFDIKTGAFYITYCEHHLRELVLLMTGVL